MSSMLLYVPTGEDGLRRLQLAADFVEALTFRPGRSNRLSPRRIAIVAEPSVCLEIALSMLGRADARTVEGGERQASPLVLFPFRHRDDDESILLAGDEDDVAASGMLDDLASLGAIEQEFERFDEAGARGLNGALAQALAWEDLETALLFSDDEAVPEPISARRLRVIRARPQIENKELVHALLERLEPSRDESLDQVRRQAVEAALALEQLLAIHDEPGRASAM